MTNTILIIGMGQGLSLGIAEKFGHEGFQVGMISRNTDKLRQIQSSLQAKGIIAAFATADVADTAQMLDAIRQIQHKLGTITVLQYNAVDFRIKHLPMPLPLPKHCCPTSKHNKALYCLPAAEVPTTPALLWLPSL
jgi:NAD(P)-dependent dehydrogenase (short-subunit alcohol dehydrogenase family)